MEDKSLQFIERFQEFPTCRPLSSWEQQVWLCDQVSPTHFAVTAQIKGEFSVEQLKQALAQLQQRHPLLRVRIALDEVQQPWFVENTAKIPLRVLLREGEQQHHCQQLLQTTSGLHHRPVERRKPRLAGDPCHLQQLFPETRL